MEEQRIGKDRLSLYSIALISATDNYIGRTPFPSSTRLPRRNQRHKILLAFRVPDHATESRHYYHRRRCSELDTTACCKLASSEPTLISTSQVDDDEDEDEAGTDNNEDGTGADNDEAEAGADDYDYEAAADSQEEDGLAMEESLFVEADEEEGDTAVEAEAQGDDKESIKSEGEAYLAESDQNV